MRIRLKYGSQRVDTSPMAQPRKKPKPAGGKIVVKYRKDRIGPMRRRRELNQAPRLWDNVFLAAAGEPLNTNPPFVPSLPPLGSVERKLLKVLAAGPLTAEEAAAKVGCSEYAARHHIENLRNTYGWWIENGQRKFWYVPVARPQFGRLDDMAA